MKTLAPKYSLYDSLEDMLAPEALSGLLSQPVKRVNCVAMEGHSGLANSELAYVDTDAGRLVLKRMSIESDWIMYVTEDRECRSVKLWQYGLWDELLPGLDNKILAAARDGSGWAFLMEDLTGNCFNWDNFPPQYVEVFLDLLARIHANFWNDPRLPDSRLGLGTAADFFRFSKRARHFTGNGFGVLPEWIRSGWEALPALLEPEVFSAMESLIEDPAPLLAAIRRYPSTLLHGDYRAENLAYNGSPIALDWQQARCSLMTIDLAWLIKQGYIHEAMTREEAVAYYRDRLENYLGERFDDDDWQAMVDLGFGVDALGSACFSAFFYQVIDEPESRAYNLNTARQQGQAVMDMLRRL